MMSDFYIAFGLNTGSLLLPSEMKAFLALQKKKKVREEIAGHNVTNRWRIIFWNGQIFLFVCFILIFFRFLLKKCKWKKNRWNIYPLSFCPRWFHVNRELPTWCLRVFVFFICIFFILLGRNYLNPGVWSVFSKCRYLISLWTHWTHYFRR